VSVQPQHPAAPDLLSHVTSLPPLSEPTHHHHHRQHSFPSSLDGLTNVTAVMVGLVAVMLRERARAVRPVACESSKGAGRQAAEVGLTGCRGMALSTVTESRVPRTIFKVLEQLTLLDGCQRVYR
jgi:hypothetical protein